MAKYLYGASVYQTFFAKNLYIISLKISKGDE